MLKMAMGVGAAKMTNATDGVLMRVCLRVRARACVRVRGPGARAHTREMKYSLSVAPGAGRRGQAAAEQRQGGHPPESISLSNFSLTGDVCVFPFPRFLERESERARESERERERESPPLSLSLSLSLSFAL